MSNYSLFREHWKFLAERNATCFAATKAHDGWASIPVAMSHGFGPPVNVGDSGQWRQA